MSELSPRMAQRLRDLYDHIDGTGPPSGLDRFNVAAAARRSHLLRLTASLAATFLAVLGVVVIGFANHQLGPARAPSTPIAPTLSPLPSASPSATPSPSPPASPSLAPSPTGVTAGWTSSSGCSTPLSQTPMTVDGVAGVRTVNPCAGSEFIEYDISAHGFEYVTSWSWYDDPSQRVRMVAELDEFIATWKFRA